MREFQKKMKRMKDEFHWMHLKQKCTNHCKTSKQQANQLAKFFRIGFVPEMSVTLY